MHLGSYSEVLRNPDEAMQAYERALQANPNSTQAMNAIGVLLKGREAFEKALEFFRAIVQLDQNNGEAWGNLGMCVDLMRRCSTDWDFRTLLLDDRKSAEGLRRLSTGIGKPEGPQGPDALVWYRYIV
jgi:tetratricopeptide (TPR) repeat protein